MNGELSGGKNGVIYESNASIYVIKLKDKEFSIKDGIGAYFMLACGFLFWNLISFDYFGAGAAIFTGVLIGVSIGYLYSQGSRLSKGNVVPLMLLTISGLSFFWVASPFIQRVNFLFLGAIYIHWISSFSGRTQGISSRSIVDWFHQSVTVPLSDFFSIFLAMKKLTKNSTRSRTVSRSILGILVFLPVLLVVLLLLSSADASFAFMIDKVQIVLSGNWLEYLGQFIIGIPVACYLFGLLYGSKQEKEKETTEPIQSEKESKPLSLEQRIENPPLENMISGFRVIPGVSVYAALASLNFVYLLFFFAQSAYLFSAFRNQLPNAITYAEYARRGFFELCLVAIINLLVIGTAYLLAKNDKPSVLKWETIALSGFTLALIGTAMSKLTMYIHYYGLTLLRVYAAWFMILLFLIFIIVIVRQFVDFNGTRAGVVGLALLLFVLIYGNIDGMIAKYNLHQYQLGKLSFLDIESMDELSDAAVPALYQAYLTIPDQEKKEAIKYAILHPSDNVYDASSKQDFRIWNYQSAKAEQIRAELNLSLKPSR